MSKTQSIALVVTIIGALNWGVYAMFGFDVVAQFSGGADQLLARMIYVLIAIAGLINIGLLFNDVRNRDEIGETRPKVKVI